MNLHERIHDVLTLRKNKCSYRQIAARLNLSIHSVRRISKGRACNLIPCGNCLLLKQEHYERYRQLRACIRVAEELELREKETASHEPDCVSPVTADASVP